MYTIYFILFLFIAFNELASINEFYHDNILQIDLKKMPLGKLSKKQLEQAYSVLGEAQQVIFQCIFF